MMTEDGVVGTALTQSQDIWPFLLYTVLVIGLISVTILAAWFIGHSLAARISVVQFRLQAPRKLAT